MKKLLGIGLTAAFLLAANPVHADTTDVDTLPIQVIENGETDGPIITPYDVQLIQPFNYVGYNAYENSFTMAPGNGKDANLWLKNNSSATIYLKFYKNGVEMFESSYSPGEQNTTTIYTTQTTSYKVYVFSKTGHKLDFSISARQF